MKKVLSILLVLTLLLTAVPMSVLAADNIVEGTCGPNLTWTLNLDTGELIVSGEGEMDSSPWSRIYYDQVESATIGEGVTSISTHAFVGCSLKSVSLPTTLKTIRRGAFRDTQLTAVTLPAGVETIESSAFTWCSQLQSITVAEGNAAFCDVEGVLYSKDMTRLLCVPAGRTEASFAVPNGVLRLDSECFSGNAGLTSISLPASVVKVDNSEMIRANHAFNRCYGLSEIKVSADNQSYCDLNGVLFSKDMKTIVAYPCSKGARYTVPASVETIGNYAFSGGGSLSLISLPEGLHRIGDFAFQLCQFEEVKIPDQVTEIGDLAFSACWEMNKITIGRGVTYIGTYAFDGCDALKNVYYSGTQEMWDSIQIQEGNECLTQAALHLGDFPTEGVGGSCGDNLTWNLTADGVLTISGSGEMKNYSNGTGYATPTAPWGEYEEILRTVQVESGVTSIGTYAFWNCSQLESVSLPNTLTKIEAYAFSDCDRLNQITIPASVTSVGGWAFLGCVNLAHIGVAEENANYCQIDGVLFDKEAESLQAYPWGKQDRSYTLPASVTQITVGVLSGAPYLEEITVAAGNTAFSAADGVLYNQTGETLVAFPAGKRCGSFTIPNNVTKVENLAFRDCRYLLELTLSGGITTIGAVMATDCQSLTKITVEEGVTSLPFGVFMNCRALRAAILPVSLTTIGDYAFSGCVNLRDVSYAGTQAQWDSVTVKSQNDPLTQAVLHVERLPEMPAGTYGPLSWSLNLDTGVLTISGQGAMPDSDTMDGTPWNAWCTSIRVVQVEAGVTSLGTNAFAFCRNLVRVVLPTTVTEIAENALLACGGSPEVYYAGTAAQWQLILIRMGNYLIDQATISYESSEPEQFESGAYGDSMSWLLDRKTGALYVNGTGPMNGQAPWASYQGEIQSIYLSDGITTIADNAFVFCRLARYAVIPEGVTKIGRQAFAFNENLQQIVLPESLDTLDWMAFEDCNSLTKVRIPANVRVADSAFSECSALEEYQVSEDNPAFSAQDGVLFDKELTTLLAYPEAKKDTAYAIPETVTTIKKDAFKNCDQLTSISIPASVASIENAAIMDCSALETVTVAAENSVYCSREGVLYEKDGTMLLLYPAARAGERYEIPDAVTTIASGAFCGSKLVTINIPDSVQSIGYSAFMNCSQLASIHLPDGLTEIPDSMLSGCISLTEIEIPSSVTRIGFLSMSGLRLTKLVLPEGVQIVSSYAFEGCPQLTDLVLPRSLTTVHHGAFGNAVQNVYYAGSEDEWNGITIMPQNEALLAANFFFHSSGPEELQYSGSCGEGLTWTLNPETGVLTVSGTGAMEDYTEASMPWSSHASRITSVVLEETVTTVGSYAFAGCTALETVVVAGELSSVGTYAFANCTSLREICFLNSVPAMDETVLDGCTGVTLSYPRTETPPVLPENASGEAYVAHAAVTEVVAAENGDVTVELAVGAAELETVYTICAVYDENGKMLGTMAAQLAPGVQTTTIPCKNGQAYTLKVFLLDNAEALIPQCETLDWGV